MLVKVRVRSTHIQPYLLRGHGGGIIKYLRIHQEHPSLSLNVRCTNKGRS